MERLRTASPKTIGAVLTIPLVIIALLMVSSESQANNDCDISVPVDEPTIQDAIDEADANQTICVDPGTYTERLNGFKDGLTLRGIGSGDVTIDVSASGSSNRGIDVSGNAGDHIEDLTLEGFTVENSASSVYALKIAFIDGLNVSDVVAQNNAYTGIDINTVNDVTLTDVEAHGNAGAGIALRNMSDVVVQNAHTSGNAWGGLALWAKSAGQLADDHNGDPDDYEDESLSNIAVSASSFSDQLVGIFAQHEGEFADIEISDNQFNDNQLQVSDETGEGALDLEEILNNNEFDRAVVVRDNPIAVPTIFSSIQDAVNAASSGQTVSVEPGTYSGAVELDVENLTLISTHGAAETIIDGNGAFVAVRAFEHLGHVTVEGFTVKNWVAGGIGQGRASRDGTALHVISNTVLASEETDQHGNSIQVTGDNSTVIDNSVEVTHQISPDWRGSGILVHSANNALVEHNYVSSSAEDNCIAIGGGMYILPGATSVDPAAEENTIRNNVVEGCANGILFEGDAKNNVVEGNQIRGNSVGIYQTSVENDLGMFEPTGNVAHFNDIVGNNTGIAIGADETFDATSNYWGHASGPGGPDGRTNPAGKTVGKGDTIEGDVDFSNWARRPFDHPSR